MMMQRSEIVFWQEVISPHVMNLAQGLARAGQQVAIEIDGLGRLHNALIAEDLSASQEAC